MVKLDKVLILTSFPFPDGKATSNRVKIFATELEKKSYIKDITIIATNDINNKIKYSDKIKIKNIKANLINKDKYLKRILQEVHTAFVLWNNALKENPNLIILSIPSIMFLIPLLFTKTRVNIILDVRDIVWEYLPKNRIMGFAKFVIRTTFKFSTSKVKLITTTNLNEAKLINLISKHKPLIVGNGISNEYFEILSRIPIKKLNRKINLTYLGNIGIAQELEILVDFAKVNQNTTIKIVGDGARLNAIKKLVNINNIFNFEFKDPVKFNHIQKLYEEADILFAQIGSSYSSAIPSKIFEYIASGKKVLIGLPEGVAKEIFSKFDGIEIFKTGDLSSMCKSFKRLLDNQFTEKLRNNNLRKLKKNYIRENHVNLMIKSIEKII